MQRVTTYLCLSILMACSEGPPETDTATTARHGASVETNQPATAAELAAPTQVIMLGTGTPLPDQYRAGPGIAVIHKGQSYLFDLGGGSVRRAIEARHRFDIPSLYPSSICCVFFTHLHSDHVADYPELTATLWWRRESKLRAYGPEGLAQLTQGMQDMMAVDVNFRLNGDQPIRNPGFHKVDVTEIQAGVVLKVDDLTIEAFEVAHGDIRPAFGYRIETADKTIVISGDTTLSETLIEKSKGVDLLFHEVVSEQGLSGLPKFWKQYHGTSHTTSSQIAQIGTLAKPKKIVLYHGLFYGAPESSVLDEVRLQYDGDVELANDLDVY